MYTPEYLRFNQVTVESKHSIIDIATIPTGYIIQVGRQPSFEITEEDLEAIYYAVNKLKTVRTYHNEPTGEE